MKPVLNRIENETIFGSSKNLPLHNLFNGPVGHPFRVMWMQQWHALFWHTREAVSEKLA